MGRQRKHPRDRRRDGTTRPSAGTPASGEKLRYPAWAVVGLALLVAALMGVVALALLNVGRSALSLGQASTSPMVRQGRTIDGIPCNDSEQLSYHEHAHLTVLLAGHSMTVPAGIGINDDTCLYWLHTHDDSGVIHMEAPRSENFTLGTFFDIWGQHLSSHGVAGHEARHRQAVRVFVNGRRYSGDPRSITLRRHTDITIEIGPPFLTPTRYAFESGL